MAVAPALLTEPIGPSLRRYANSAAIIETDLEPAELLALLKRSDPLGRHRALRVKVLHALGEIGDPRVLGELKPFFRTLLPAGSPEERRAAFQTLARFPADVARPLAQQGLRSLDPEIRNVCRRLLEGVGARPEPPR